MPTALDDTIATYEVFKAQLDRYDDLEPNMDFLSEYTKNNNLDFAGNELIRIMMQYLPLGNMLVKRLQMCLNLIKVIILG